MRNSIIQINQVYSNGRVQSLGYPPFKTLTKVQILELLKQLLVSVPQLERDTSIRE